LDHRVELSHLLVSAKADRHIPRLEIQIGDGLYGSFLDAEYHHAGKAEAINNQYKQVPCIGMGSFIKIIIPDRPTTSP